MFRGVSYLNLDAKGRLAIPARQRERLARMCDSRLVITADPQHCLLVYPETTWTDIERKLMGLPSFDPTSRSMQRLLIGYANDVEIDTQGRVMVTSEQREYANLDKRVALVGVGNKFELWDEAIWRQTLKEAEASFDMANLAANSELGSLSI
ncbi:division/cell wall cluster transcriptional repressor MraZ [Thiorhodovibrio frisius]|uniref:Transcriptional regulator MraZ n=1 Tax=Thiorhodovibrio frisius TaxID=631362 RepID=H8Z3J2_9GAMM|nr:division/cell wall cluster transcriptional repressor MraZ [Thiorhodovibrio frisius]EIC21900.1 mraZ protein [Thiorhodovibrio frisius]WPL24189.1 cell division protein MraZ [Thiorhodovibrio frisius]